MEDMKQDDIEGALTDHRKDLQRVDNGSETNEEMTLTNWGHYVDVIWELKNTLPGYVERELYRNHIRGLPREEFAEAVKRLHNDLREWDKDKMNDATPEQYREMAKAWLQKKEDIKEGKHRPLEEEGEHTIYPASGMTKYMNIMRDLNAVKTEREEVRVGGETYDDKKREEEGKEEEQEEQEEKKEAQHHQMRIRMTNEKKEQSSTQQHWSTTEEPISTRAEKKNKRPHEKKKRAQ